LARFASGLREDRRVIKTIIFDLGGVIVPFDFNRAYKRIEQEFGHSPDYIREKIAATNLVIEFESGRMESRRFVEELTACIGISLDFDQFRELWSSIFLPHTLIPESLLVSLKQKYRLLLLSNTNPLHFAMIRENYPLLKHFDHFILSYEVGAMKPAPAIYQAALSQAQCEPGQCFFTDDIAVFVEGAVREGIDAVRFEGEEKLRKHLADRGIAL